MWSACGYNVQVIISSSVCLITISASIYIPIIYFGTSPKFRTNVPALFYCLKEENNTSFVKPVNHINERMKTDPLNQADKHQVPKVPVAPTMAENPDLPEMPASNTNTPNIGLTSGQCDLHLSRMEGDSDL
ncbi:opsin 6, group member b [Callorhinchus milii]|uniref:opsin 6, group member b n=1 Tax=Callorhinchus milii TaxID=7868 RepID=UPI001C3FD888|nr:opsin 6, group member b [Callorhinchus milii]